MLNKSDRVLKERLQDRKEWVEYFQNVYYITILTIKLLMNFIKKDP